MATKVWTESEDGSIQYISLTVEYLEQALGVMRNSFFIYESVSRAVHLHTNSNARLELEALSIGAARDGLSIIAIEKSTNKVVGVCFNKIQIASSDDSYFEKFAATCKEAESKALILFMSEADAECDLFTLCNVTCALEMMFLAVLPEYGKRNIGTTLCRTSIDAAKLIKSGVNCKVSITNESLNLEPVPEIVCTMFTSSTSQKIGKHIGLKVAKEISYEKFKFQGKTFSEVIGPESPFVTVLYCTL